MPQALANVRAKSNVRAKAKSKVGRLSIASPA
jgi:hypothetical protein